MAEGRPARGSRLELIASVAHELKTPVAAVRGAVAALRDDNEVDDETRERLLGVVDDAAAQLERLVDDLLLAGRLDAERLAVEIVRCDAHDIAARVVEAARATLPPDTSIELSVPIGLRAAAADPERLRQALANLVGNAVAHAAGSGRVRVNMDEIDERLRIAVSDDGPGIPPEDHERVFERFQRGRTGAPGSGLGLYLARGLVEAMGGTVSLESAPDRGSTFTLELPLADDARPG
jgi:two-component system sensor histidine kinase KdpD